MVSPNSWSQLDIGERTVVATHWCEWLCAAWSLPRMRFIVRDFEDGEKRGEFAPETGSVTIARRLLADGADVAGTLAHELRHAWQEHSLERGEHPLGATGAQAWSEAERAYDAESFLNPYTNELEIDADEAEEYVRAGYCEE